MYRLVHKEGPRPKERLHSIRIVESPVVPQVPSRPSKMLNIAIAGILGLFVGIFATFFKNYTEGFS